jgi:hypothetical protein
MMTSSWSGGTEISLGAWDDTEPTAERIAMCKRLFPYAPDEPDPLTGFTYNDCWEEGLCIRRCEDQPAADRDGCFNLCMFGKNLVTGFVVGSSMGLGTKLAIGGGIVASAVLIALAVA